MNVYCSQITVEPKCGRLLAFDAKNPPRPANSKGHRCRLGSWFTFDPKRRNIALDLTAAAISSTRFDKNNEPLHTILRSLFEMPITEKPQLPVNIKTGNTLLLFGV